MTRLLLDANLSEATAQFLRARFGFDVARIGRSSDRGMSDQQVAAHAFTDGRVIITFDLDFGEAFYFNRLEDVSVVILRVDRQTQAIEAVNSILESFFVNHGAGFDETPALAIVTKTLVRLILRG